MTLVVARRYRAPMGRRFAVSLVTVLLLTVAAPTALGKTFFGLGGETFAPGEIVRAEIAGCGNNDSCGRVVEGLRVFLAPGPAPRAGRADAAGLRLAGRITRRGVLVFRAPNRRGTWHLLARPYRGAPEFLAVSAGFLVRPTPSSRP